MNPDDTKSPSRNIAVPSRDSAADIIRGQLDDLYSGTDRTASTKRDTAAEDTQTSVQSAPAPTSNPSTAQTVTTQDAVAPADWQQYHSAWQDYYKEYYDRYYTGHVQRVLDENKSQKAPVPAQSQQAKEISALQEKLRAKVTDGAKKARKSRHFIPVLAAVLVMALFGFLQYNSMLIGTVQAYVSPGAINPQNIIVDPTASTKVGPEPRLIIPKINVDVPVVYNVANTHQAQMAAMELGVAHFAIPGAESTPGQIGNTVYAGHSSNDIFGAGEYKFIFVQLDKLQPGDTIYVNYQSTRYTYVVTKHEVVKPTDVQALIYPTEKPMLTLITCTPIGTALNRLLVTAEQVSPDPSKAAPAAAATGTSGGGMPGTSPTILERMFGNNG